jgi:hypothetical protein
MVILPSTICFVAFDAIPHKFQISMANCDSCVEFDRWRQLRESGIAVDFRRIFRIDSDFGCEDNYLIDLSVFEDGSGLDEIDGNLSEIYRRSEDGSLVIVNSKNGFASKDNFRSDILRFRFYSFDFRRRYSLIIPLSCLPFSSPSSLSIFFPFS